MLTDDEFRAFLKALGARIKHLRKEKNIRLRDITVSTGYYDAQWRKYEAGGGLTVQSLLKIALALDVSLDTLFDGLGSWPKQSVDEILECKKAGTKVASKRRQTPAKRVSAPKGDAVVRDQADTSLPSRRRPAL